MGSIKSNHNYPLHSYVFISTLLLRTSTHSRSRSCCCINHRCHNLCVEIYHCLFTTRHRGVVDIGSDKIECMTLQTSQPDVCIQNCISISCATLPYETTFQAGICSTTFISAVLRSPCLEVTSRIPNSKLIKDESQYNCDRNRN